MTNTVFRTKNEPIAEQKLPEGKEPSRGSEVDVEVPYLDYEKANGQPYLAEYFKLGDTWNDSEGGFPQEIHKIRSYVEDKIQSGEVANSISAIKDLIKRMEKVNNLTKEERAVVKIEVLANYVEFLMKNEDIKRNLRRYSGY